VHDNSGRKPNIVEKIAMKPKDKLQTSKEFSAALGPAPGRQDRRKTVRMHGTPIYIWENGKVVAEKL
jgi:hypothetical protein